jgi:hypothetical protein
MSETKQESKTEIKFPTTRMRDVLIDICPKCECLHLRGLTGGLIDGLGKNELKCATQVGWLPPATSGQTQLEPELCGNIITASNQNTFTIRHLSIRERQEYYAIVVEANMANSKSMGANPKLMDYMLIHATVKAPLPLKTKEDIDSAPIDGTVLETLYSAEMEYNSVPLAPSSGLRQQSTQTPLPSATTTR